jgi:flavorubredoxin
MPPIRRCEPENIAPDTRVIRQLYGEGVAPVAIFVNSMVITGPEPVIVDTNSVSVRDDWFADVFSIVEPEDVRWLFLSHDDPDHTGNLIEAMELCPNATLVTNWFSARAPRHRDGPADAPDALGGGRRDVRRHEAMVAAITAA